MVALRLHLRAERRSQPIQEVAQPSRLRLRCVGQPEPPNPQGDQPGLLEAALTRVDANPVEQPQVAAKRLVSADPLVVVQQIAAAVVRELPGNEGDVSRRQRPG